MRLRFLAGNAPFGSLCRKYTFNVEVNRCFRCEALGVVWFLISCFFTWGLMGGNFSTFISIFMLSTSTIFVFNFAAGVPGYYAP